MVKTLSSAKPHLVVLVGAPGVGKTQFATRFAETFSAPLVSLDALEAILFSGDEQSQDERRALTAIADLQLEQLLKADKTIVVDGLGDTKTNRVELKKRAHAAGFTTLFVWVQTDQPTALLRATKPARSSAKKAISEDTYQLLSRRFTPPTASEKPVVISGKHTYATQLKIVLKRIVEPRSDAAATPVTSDSRPVSRPQRSGRNIVIR